MLITLLTLVQCAISSGLLLEIALHWQTPGRKYYPQHQQHQWDRTNWAALFLGLLCKQTQPITTSTSVSTKLPSFSIRHESLSNSSPGRLLLRHPAPCSTYTFHHLRTNVWVNIQSSPTIGAFLLRPLNSCILNCFSLEVLFIWKSLAHSRNSAAN